MVDDGASAGGRRRLEGEVVNDDGTVTDADNNLVGTVDPDTQDVKDADGNVVGVVDEDGNYIPASAADEANAVVVNEDGTVVDADGNVIGVVDAADTNGYVVDADANVVGRVDEDGNFVAGTVDENGNFVEAAGEVDDAAAAEEAPPAPTTELKPTILAVKTVASFEIIDEALGEENNKKYLMYSEEKNVV